VDALLNIFLGGSQLGRRQLLRFGVDRLSGIVPSSGVGRLLWAWAFVTNIRAGFPGRRRLASLGGSVALWWFLTVTWRRAFLSLGRRLLHFGRRRYGRRSRGRGRLRSWRLSGLIVGFVEHVRRDLAFPIHHLPIACVLGYGRCGWRRAGFCGVGRS